MIRNTLELANTNAWPALVANQHQQQATSTIVMLALIDEASKPGTFERKLETQLQRNGLPIVKYQLEEGTAQHMATLIAGAHSGTQTATRTATRTPVQRTSTASGSGAAVPIKTKTFMTKYSRDQEKFIKRSHGLVDISFTADESSTSHTKKPKHNPLHLRPQPMEYAQHTDSTDTDAPRAQPHTQPLIPLPSFSSTGKLTDMMNDPQNALRLLGIRLRTQKLHLTDQAKNMIPKGQKSKKTRNSVNELSDLIRNDQVIIDGQSKIEIMKDIENILKNNYGEHEVSAELDYSGPRTVNRMHSEPESDFHLKPYKSNKPTGTHSDIWY